MKRSFVIYISIFLIAVVAYLFTTDNFKSSSVIKARMAAKNGNYEYALENFEKSFAAGNKNPVDREMYVDMLISGNRGYLQQKKLLDFNSDNITDSASERASDYLYEKEDEIYIKYPKNYAEQAPYNHKILRWGDTHITYGIINPEDAPAYYVSEIENAFNTWKNSLGENFMLSRVKLEPNISVVFHKEQPNTNGGTRYIAAYTKPEINNDELLNMQIDFYVKDASGKEFPPHQVYNTALHEIGHALGMMGHSEDRKDIMYISANAAAGNSKGQLSEADINTVKLLYATMPDITDKKPENADYIPYIVSGNNKRITENKIKAARDYIKKAPMLPTGYIDLAEVFVNKKDYDKAINYLEKALTLTDNYETISMIYYDLAIVYNLNGQYNEAEEALDKSVKTGGSSETHRHLSAQIHSSQGKTNEAIQEYYNLLLDYPDDINYMIGLANIYIKQKQFFKARKVIREFIQKNPNQKNDPAIKSYGILAMFI